MIVAGAAITCTVADTAYQLSATTLLVKGLHVQQRYDNAGVVFVGDSTLKPSTNTGVYAELEVPATTKIPSYDPSEIGSQNGLNVSAFWVASTQAGDVVYWSYDQQ